MVDPSASGAANLPPIDAFRFGTAGLPSSMPGVSIFAGIRALAGIGLQAMELAFVHRVHISREEAPLVAQTAMANGITLSVHASYYINLNSHDPDKVRASRQRILQAARIGYLCGARKIVFHPGWRQDDPQEIVYRHMREQLSEIAAILADEKVTVWLCPETTGKQAQFGALDELLQLAEDIPGVSPCLDFAHLYARSGGKGDEEYFEQILDQVQATLGRKTGLLDLHIHLSGIEYGPQGEKRHRRLAESALDFWGLLRVLHRRQAGGMIICESPANDADGILLWKIWQQLAVSDC